jgi:hypothetical protein
LKGTPRHSAFTVAGATKCLYAPMFSRNESKGFELPLAYLYAASLNIVQKKLDVTRNRCDALSI